ncbi:hypothetical protein [Cellulomonas hominis]
MTNRSVQTVDDVLALLDTLFEDRADRWTDRAGSPWWDRSSADRGRDVPFFRLAPDGSLVRWRDAGLLELPAGCPGGRARPVDRRARPGRERAVAAGVEVTFVSADIFAWAPPEGGP